MGGRRAVITMLSALAVFSTGLAVSAVVDEGRATADGATVIAGIADPTAVSQLTTFDDIDRDPAGNVVIMSNGRVSRVATDGTLTLLAGGGRSSADGIPATSAGVVATHVSVGADGAILLPSNGQLRRVDPVTGVITTIAGTGATPVGAPVPDGAVATSVALTPSSVSGASNGDVVFTTLASLSVRKVTAATGLLSTVVPWVAGTVACTGLNGPASAVRARTIGAVAMSQTGDVYVGVSCLIGAPSYSAVIRIDMAGNSTVVAGGGASTATSGVATGAALKSIGKIFPGPGGAFDVVTNIGLLRVAADGTYTTLARGAAPCAMAEGQPALASCFRTATVRNDGTAVLIGDTSTDTFPYRAFGVITSGTVHIMSHVGEPADGAPATSGPLTRISSLAALPDGRLAFGAGNDVRVRSLSTDGKLSTVAGSGAFDAPTFGGPAAASALRIVTSVSVGASGDVYLVSGDQIMKVSGGILTAVAGNGINGTTADDPTPGSALTAALRPLKTTVDANGNVYFTDYLECAVAPCRLSIRKVAPSGALSTAHTPSLTAGVVADIAAAPDGTIVFSTTEAGKLFRLNPVTGGVTTIAFAAIAGSARLAVDGTGAILALDTAALWKVPASGPAVQISESDTLFLGGVAVDAVGNVYAAWDEAIHRFPVAGPPTTTTPPTTQPGAGSGGPTPGTSVLNSLTPVRLFDTRPDEAQGAVTITKKKYGGPDNILTIHVAGTAGVPTTGVAAVSLNVTVTQPDAGGFLTVYPCGQRPNASNLNFTAGQTIPNAVIAPISPNGDICLFSNVDTHVLADINGWFATGSGLTPISPTRLFDTRPDEAQGAVTITKKKYGGPDNILTIHVAGTAGVPTTGVAAVSLNVTVTQPDAGGFLTVYPCGQRPNASNLNFTAGQTIPNAVIAPISPNGDICLFSNVDTHVLADINGWFAR